MISLIPDLLKERGMTASDLHLKMQQNEFTELSYQSLIRLANKKQPVLPGSTKIETLHKIAVTLGVRVDDLYTVQEIKQSS
ncbi:MAG: helix-turn-helix domain-containing protein [Anaerolineae bacterium]|nr:helix-turn-helix domain-containing protein [Anaerolineae bacterium]